MGLFASEPSGIEKAVRNATDESLISEDWSQIIKVCDEVSTNPAKHGPEAVKVLRSRLTMANGNVQLYSLTLLNALAQNCGPVLQREIAAHPTASCLSKLGLSSSTHRTVLTRLIEILAQLSEQFAPDSTLGQIQRVYERVCQAHPDLVQKTKHKEVKKAPVVPPQDEEEDEDLKRALELSLKEMGSGSRPGINGRGPSNGLSNGAGNEGPAPGFGANSGSVRPRHFVRALYDFTATEDGELTFKTGDLIEVLDRVYKEWWKGVLRGNEGIFPVNYVEETTEYNDSNQVQPAGSVLPLHENVANTPPPQSPVTINEEYIFSQVSSVDKLLTILSSAVQSGDGTSVITNEEVQQMYHQIAAMRPRLVQLIDEYAAKKQDLVDLNQKLLHARRSYDQLMADAASGRRRLSQGSQPAPPAAQSASPALSAPAYAPAQAQPSYDSPVPAATGPYAPQTYPAHGQTAQHGQTAHGQTAHGQSLPQYTQPLTPQYTQPLTPQYTQPTPQYPQAATPQYAQAATPQYNQPATPQYPQSATPQYTQPPTQYPQSTPYAQPASQYTQAATATQTAPQHESHAYSQQPYHQSHTSQQYIQPQYTPGTGAPDTPRAY